MHSGIGQKLNILLVEDSVDDTELTLARGCPEFCVNGVWVNGSASDPRIGW